MISAHNDNNNNTSSKTQRKIIDFEIKMKIIKAYEKGRKVNKIANEFGLPHSTVSTILKAKDKIKKLVKTSKGSNVILTRQRKGFIPEMEKFVLMWYDDQIQKRVPITFPMLQAKAQSIFKILKERSGSESIETFTASNGWLQKFRRRYNLHNRKITDELVNCDVEKFVSQFNDIIERGGYLPEQLFNVNETGLFWKRLPELAFIHHEVEVITDFNDRVTLLLGGNASGFKMKPFLIYHSENAQTLEDFNEETPPVYCRANTKAWMTQKLFEDWFNNCFAPSVKDYCLKNEIPFKIMLLLDNNFTHPKNLNHPNIKVMYLPKYLASILQPVDQGITAIFKAYYLHATLFKAVTITDNCGVTFHNFWKSYHILDCTAIVDLAWKGVTEKCMQGAWKKCFKRLINDSSDELNFENEDHFDDLLKEIVKLAKGLDLDIEINDIQELIDYDIELSIEDLIDLEAEHNLGQRNELYDETSNEDSIDMEPPQLLEKNDEIKKEFTVQGLESVFSKVYSALLELESMDQNIKRFKKVQRQTNEVLQCY